MVARCPEPSRRLQSGLCGVLESTEERFGGQGALRAEGAALLVTGLWPWAGCCTPNKFFAVLKINCSPT